MGQWCKEIPSPGGKVARPSVSEEIAGRKRNAGGKLKVSTIYKTYSEVGHRIRHGVGLCISNHQSIPPAFLFSQLR